MNTAPEAPDTPKNPPTRRWRGLLRRRWVVWTSIAVVGATLIGAAVTVPLVAAAGERADAVDTWRTSLVGVFTADDAYETARAAHTAAADAGTADVTALNSILDALPADLVDPATTRDDVAAAAAALQAAASAAVPTQDIPDLPDVSAPTSTGDPAAVDEATAGSSVAQLLDAAAGFRAQTADLEDRQSKLSDSKGAIEAAREGTRAPLAALVAAAIAKAPTFPVDRAGEGERTAFTTAMETLRPAAAVSDATAVDVLPMVKTYVDALGAARASHDTAVAAEQEAQRQAEENANGGSSSDRSSNSTGNSGSHGSGGGSSGGTGGGGGGSSNGSSGGGGGTTGGGGSTGGSGGSSGGGGSSGTSWQPLKLIRSSTDCYSSNVNGQEATYGSTLMVPHDAAGYSTYEISGYGWGVTWECF